MKIRQFEFRLLLQAAFITFVILMWSFAERAALLPSLSDFSPTVSIANR